MVIVTILLVPIGGYYINGYCWLLVVMNGYYINGYWWISMNINVIILVDIGYILS
jgi:hypothetical protein